MGVPLPSSRRRRGPQAGQAVGWAWKRRLAGSSYSARQAVEGRSIALDLDQDVAELVADEAAQAALRRQPVDERPEADALHDAANGDGPTDSHAWHPGRVTVTTRAVCLTAVGARGDT